jgi:hypothetical protein
MRGCAGVIEVSSASDIANVVERVVKYDPKVTQVGMAGRGVWQRHRGAAQRIASAVRDG